MLDAIVDPSAATSMENRRRRYFFLTTTAVHPYNYKLLKEDVNKWAMTQPRASEVNALAKKVIRERDSRTHPRLCCWTWRHSRCFERTTLLRKVICAITVRAPTSCFLQLFSVRLTSISIVFRNDFKSATRRFWLTCCQFKPSHLIEPITAGLQVKAQEH